jgi:hypothetical protein
MRFVTCVVSGRESTVIRWFIWLPSVLRELEESDEVLMSIWLRVFSVLAGELAVEYEEAA